MLSTEVDRLERENFTLKKALQELGRKMEENQNAKPRSCEYCRYYFQHYIRNASGHYSPVACGHCVRCRTRKGKKPDETCNYFEMGTLEMHYLDLERSSHEE